MTKLSQKSTSNKTPSYTVLIVIALLFGMIGLIVGLGSSFLLPKSFVEPQLPTLASLAVGQVATLVPSPPPAQRFQVNPDDDPSFGPTDAHVTVVVFSDFACSFCGHFARTTLLPLIKTYGNDVRFVYRDYPITSPLSTLSAHAAECVADQGQFWAYHDRLFAEQMQLNDDMLTSIAQELGVNMSQFDTCLADESYEAEVLADYQAGQELGLSGAPAIFVNGIRLQGAHPYDEIAEIIDQELG